VVEPLLQALGIILEWQNILAMVCGVIGGVLFGAMPGLTSAMAVALLLPLTYGMSPLVALAAIAGIHNGGSYGGAIPGVLLRIPGSPAAVITVLDGYPMAQKGYAAQALRIAVVSSSVGGMVSAVSLMLLAPPLARFALAFGPPEIFWVNMFGLVSIAVLLGDDPIKGMLATCFGLLFGLVGIDLVTGYERFTFDIIQLSTGIPLVVMLVGLYALPPAWEMAERAIMTGITSKDLRFKGRANIAQWPWIQILPAWLRSCIIGIIAGILPGVGGIIGGFIAYGQTKRASKDPDSFGKGNPVGIAVAECANNADNGASMIPTLTLGVPGSGFAALVLGALMVHGLHPGPDLFKASADIVYGYMWAMLFTSAMLIVIGGLMISRLFANVLRLPQVQLAPVIVCLTVVGVFGLQNSIFDVYVAFVFGFIGYAMERLKIPIAPVILGFVLGPKVEFNLRTSLLLGHGEWSILWTRPICRVIMAMILFVLISPTIKASWKKWKR
jgi:putative tricarboxylic transport membrane protein